MRLIKTLLFWGLTATCLRLQVRALDWDCLPTGQWVPIPTHGKAAPKVFHGGATIIPEQDLVIFFGSDTHAPTPLEKGESNAFWRLDLKNLTWSQDYQQDPKSKYRILDDHETETTSGRPWAMHTFADVDWDPVAERVVVVSGELHARFNPEARFPMFKTKDWWVDLQHSHWEYEPKSKKWKRLGVRAPLVFAGAMVWDSDRQQLIAHNGSKTWEFNRTNQTWTEFDAPSKPGWHQNMVYDTFSHLVLLLGRNPGDETLFSYDPQKHAWRTLDTEGHPLPANGAAIAYDTKNHVMMYLANDYPDQYNNPSGKAVTFLYHSEDRRWEQLKTKSPDLYGMNYLMQYDPKRKVFLHFEKNKDSGEHIRVWAFRYR